MGQREVLGDKLTKEHREDVNDRGGDEGRDAGGQAPGQPGCAEPSHQQVRQRGLRRVAEQDRGQRDAHLGTRQLGGQGTGGAQDGGGSSVPLVRLLVKDGLVHSDKREFGGDEDEGAGGKNDAEEEHKDGRHRCLLSTRPGRATGTRAGRGQERAAEKPTVSQSMMHPV